ncbi:MAG: hypothetical protein A2268_09260 [Candidatus Raymondbacteria bacterium RifOxyA12_full_50_37]|uniref:Uncharacterized protein n=1 Tax=Candidatus Raymondbacteria bacterium RIFOXYD12_FULL_49_13 TaxID=1817890 RepID=A0A1F7FGN4_UNCRA|nr:MAG: hypothetical protein A2268_09260 [Candidatus Raymondbacteria bacterium RifOxyA12_full_50_37]OGJ91553.1 MAG: hypothetical protein A2248_09810 [Candidatus Raymondbacteria bacterium RIFOXYA2_FULL_49_16]OGJ95484.1 MAG: hypothetical protein A2350_11890 [Candidatus Raymondbacteria bacterium RifOxyB12_full_50_8]OGK00210.1 MAG: hypothetical protein A2487_09915 [Candidatus Raymondbacteria bacterium RifOxyC12_full_50_8]OGK05657.1 MAG: hypothetical protein A2519_06130 [Candidatus Raymondbacteria b
MVYSYGCSDLIANALRGGKEVIAAKPETINPARTKKLALRKMFISLPFWLLIHLLIYIKCLIVAIGLPLLAENLSIFFRHFFWII